MSINPKIKNDKISDYLGTEDSIEALEKAVNNGQTRLAMEVILDLLSEVTERLILLEESINAPKEEVKVVNNITPTEAAPNKAKIKETVTEVIQEEKK